MIDWFSFEAHKSNPWLNQFTWNLAWIASLFLLNSLTWILYLCLENKSLSLFIHLLAWTLKTTRFSILHSGICDGCWSKKDKYLVIYIIQKPPRLGIVSINYGAYNSCNHCDIVPFKFVKLFRHWRQGTWTGIFSIAYV